ncbi:MAG: heat-inducible transcription repressor HrcA [Ignavibacteriales bacterium]|nr:heat-inducible transcription repressor HrcA [Ignavibacteriales bacterium]
METERRTENLSRREGDILRHVVHNYIQTASPVGSRYISKHFESSLSPATIRNVMADLEEDGFLSHPHTSAGRIPTDQGYRYYVDYLMDIENLTEMEKQAIQEYLGHTPDPNELLRETSKLLAKISRQLSVVSSPHLSSGIFEKLELIPIASSRLLVVLSIRSGLVRTIMMEVGSEVKREILDGIAALLNERISGLTLQQIRDTFAERVRDVSGEQTGLIRLFIESVDQLFNDEKDEKLHISGTNALIEQPEFVDPANFRSVIELIENEDFIVHLLEKHDDSGRNYVITIGSENDEQRARDYSIVTANYEFNGVRGKLGVIGPKRMNYSKVIPLVDHVARAIAKLLIP